MNNNVLVLSPHADDATIFVGGTIARLAAEGKKVYIARITNDDFDSKGIDTQTAILRNREEADNAYAALGAYETIHLGKRSDYMSDEPYNEFRGEIVRLIRRIMPYSIYFFDADTRGETNCDHKITANAADEALWISTFDNHYPEHFKEGLSVFSVPETVYFSTNPDETYTCSDITDFMDTKIKALKCHKTPINNMLLNARLSAQCAEMPTEEIDEIISSDRDIVIDMFARKLAAGIGEPFGIEYGELIKAKGPSLGIFGN